MQARFLISLTAVVLSVASAWPARSAEPQRVIHIGTDVDAQSMDPRLQRDTTGYRVTI